MDSDQVRRELLRAGFFCQLLPDVGRLHRLVGSEQRLECVELGGSARPGRVAGISLCLWIGAELAVVSIPSGALYVTLEPRGVLDLARAILSGEYHPRGRAQYGMPDAAQKRFGLRLCGVFVACRDTGCERLNDVAASDLPRAMRREEFEACLARRGGQVNWTTAGLGIARLGQAEFFTRFGPEGIGDALQPLLFYGEIRDTPDYGLVLEMLTDDLECAVFDEGWGNRVHFDDPYYSSTNEREPPAAPRNWRP